MPTVVDKTPEEIAQWRAQLLSRTQLSFEELAERAESSRLSAEELEIRQTLQGLDHRLKAV